MTSSRSQVIFKLVPVTTTCPVKKVVVSVPMVLESKPSLTMSVGACAGPAAACRGRAPPARAEARREGRESSFHQAMSLNCS